MALYVRMSVAEANKVEGSMSLCVGTNEILASNMTLLEKVKQGHFENANYAILIFAIFSSFITAKSV